MTTLSCSYTTNTPEPTKTSISTNTPRPTSTRRPTSTPAPTQYYATGSINARSCSDTSCGIVTVLSRGTVVYVTDTVEGQSVSGSTDWYQGTLEDGQEVFVHTSLLSRTKPSTTSSSTTNTNSSSSSNSSSTSSNPPPATSVPVTQPEQPPAPTLPPEPVSVAPPAASYTCNCSKTCGEMTCDEAYFQLNNCGCNRRDGDGDGVPCESICPDG